MKRKVKVKEVIIEKDPLWGKRFYKVTKKGCEFI